MGEEASKRRETGMGGAFVPEVFEEGVIRMNRAERRRAGRAEEKTAIYNLTADDLNNIRKQEIDNTIKMLSNRVAVDTMKMMLVIPVNVLVSDYWQKTAKTRIPKFVEDCMSLYKAWETGMVDMEDMQKLAEEYAGIKLLGENIPD